MSLRLGVILVAVAAVGAYLFRRLWLRRAQRKAAFFTYATPAAPRVREGIVRLQAALAGMANLRRGLEESLAEPSPTNDCVTSAGPVADQSRRDPLLASLDRMGALLESQPPTYANYLAVYRGLAGSGGALAAAADAYTARGHAVHQELDPGAGCAGIEAQIGRLLVSMGEQLREVARAVHVLGVALDVE